MFFGGNFRANTASQLVLASYAAAENLFNVNLCFEPVAHFLSDSVSFFEYQTN